MCTGEGVGGLLNATFGNAAKLIIAIAALRAGLDEVVKASLAGDDADARYDRADSAGGVRACSARAPVGSRAGRRYAKATTVAVPRGRRDGGTR